MKHTLLILFAACYGILFSQTTPTPPPVPNSWVKKNDFTGLKRERAVAFTINGVGYIGTGVDTAEIVRKDLWRYDDITDSWTQMANLPGSERRNAVGFAIGNYGYITTGINTANATDVGATKLSDNWRYDPASNSWTAMAPFPGNNGQGMYFGACFVIDNEAFVVAGKHGPNNYTSNMYMYDPAQDLWYLGPSFPGGVRYQLSALAVDGKGYVGLGTDQDLYRRDWWEYKRSTNTWAQRADLPASARASAVTFTIADRGFVCMGTNGGMLDDLWEYNPFDNSWSVRAPYGGSPRKNAVAFVLGSRAYVGTGKGVSGKKQSIHEYHPMWTLGLEESEMEVSVYPNPTSDVIQISSEFQPEKVTLINMLGEQVRSASNTKTLSVRDLPSGTYQLIVQNGTKVANTTVTIL
ncbi:MAG: T9SS type A sorting domain-containing protein [Fluviicola sp.]